MPLDGSGIHQLGLFLPERDRDRNRNVRLGGIRSTSDRETLIKDVQNARKRRKEIKAKQDASMKILMFWRKQKILKGIANLSRSVRGVVLSRALGVISEMKDSAMISIQGPAASEISSALLSAALSIILFYDPVKDNDDFTKLLNLFSMTICIPGVGTVPAVYISMVYDLDLWTITYEKLLRMVLKFIFDCVHDHSGYLSSDAVRSISKYFLSLEIIGTISDDVTRERLRAVIYHLFSSVCNKHPSLIRGIERSAENNLTRPEIMDLYICISSMSLATYTGISLAELCSRISLSLFSDPQIVSNIMKERYEVFCANFNYLHYLEVLHVNLFDVIYYVDIRKSPKREDPANPPRVSNPSIGGIGARASLGAPAADNEWCPIEACLDDSPDYNSILHLVLNTLDVGVRICDSRKCGNIARALMLYINKVTDFLPIRFYKMLRSIKSDSCVMNDAQAFYMFDDESSITDRSGGEECTFSDEISARIHLHSTVTCDLIDRIISYLPTDPEKPLETLSLTSEFTLKAIFLCSKYLNAEGNYFLTRDNHHLLRVLMPSLKSFSIWNSIPSKQDINSDWKLQHYVPSPSILVLVILIVLEACLHTTDRDFANGVAILSFEETKKIVEIARVRWMKHLSFYIYSNTMSIYFPAFSSSMILGTMAVYSITNLLRNVHLKECGYYEPDFWTYDESHFDIDVDCHQLEKYGSIMLKSKRSSRKTLPVIDEDHIKDMYECDIRNELVLGGAYLDDHFMEIFSQDDCGYSSRAFREAVRHKSRIFIFIKYLPFLIPFEVRWRIFSSVMIIQYKPNVMKISRFFNHRGDSQRSNESIVIRRKCLFEDGYTQMSRERFDLRSDIHVTMIDEYNNKEDGVDAGGIFKEFLTDTIGLATDPSYGLFARNEYNDYYPCPLNSSIDIDSEEGHSLQYRFVGKLLGKCLFEGISANMSFSPIFLANITKRNLSFNDMLSFDENLYNGMITLYNMTRGEVESCMLNFTIDIPTLDGLKSIPLVPGGENIDVTYDNRLTYITLVAKALLHNQMALQCSEISTGMSESIDLDWLQLFSDLELYKVYGGYRSPIDVEDFKNNVNYNGYTDGCPSVIFFWNVVGNMSQELLGKLLKFTTGSPRPPVLGFSQLDPKYCIKRSQPSKKNGLPHSSACFNLLSLPEYDTEDILEEKLKIAIESSNSFYTQ